MSFDGVRKEITDTILAELAPQAPSVPICFEGNKFDQPQGPWFYISILPGDSKRMEVSSARRYRHYGVINVQIQVPQDKGTKQLRDLAQAAFNVLVDRNWLVSGGGRLTTHCCRTRNRGLQNGYLIYNLQIEYYYDAAMGQ